VLIRFRHGRAVLDELPGWVSWRPTKLLDLLMGVRVDPWYIAMLSVYPAEKWILEWTATGQPKFTQQGLETYARARTDWLGLSLEDVLAFWEKPDEPPEALAETLLGMKTLFQHAVSAAMNERKLVPELLPHLARVRWPEDRQAADVPDVTAFGAWSVTQLLTKRRRESVLAVCVHCGEPWLPPRRDARYCWRQAPGRQSSCRATAAQHAYLESHGDYSRERRRLGQRVRRGRLDQREYDAWKQRNRPGDRGVDWVPFDEWKEAANG